ncbi:FtsW/RodA/SpoVE family cell cycle protein [Saprospira sp. CCB-QB6]|uniref:FtsW/RodA/SpoVE family cell cycle protein n=1 Tax=Saprospira sp. CCB-QB6 TaxID=3023936 RepID=UPI0023490EAB|nr:FtsW/RodA/SpoVE family cell cycle protein [Saprospira sp. CCB-QB6]WCL82090.1 FtsW/RodA/SpoVE family cell cycle protein [Saprospira sp. CCB-QB6]
MSSSMSVFQKRIGALLQGDQVIWLVLGLLGIISILTVYSSAEVLANRNGVGTESFLVKHIMLLIASVVVMYIAHLIHYKRYARWSTIMLVLSVLMLLFTMFFGTELNGASRWIKIPFVGITFQTSDFAKISLILYVARTISLLQEKKGSLLELVLPVLLVCVLIAPSDLSSALVLFFTCILLMFIGRVEIRSLISLVMLGVGLFAMLVILSDFVDWIRVDTWVSRLRSFMDGAGSGDVFQVEQAKMAIARGGFFGVGPGNGVQAHFLPHSYSDYIYCIIIEEYGIIGGIFVVCLYLALLYRTIRMVHRSPKTFGAMLAFGLCASMVIQAFAHMAVNVNLMPVTGLTLPFVSMGGTSLMFTGLSFGVMLSVSRNIEKNQPKKEAKEEAA